VFDEGLARKAARNLRKVREKKPLIHSITNFVVMNYTANALLACGASAVMAHGDEEVEEMVSLADALVLNLGTLTGARVETMVKAGKQANKRGIPIILDPVGAGATTLRTEAAKRLITELSIRVVRGNPSEVLSLARMGLKSKGVESVHLVAEAEETASNLARTRELTVAVTGKIDFVTDGTRAFRVHNGHPMMRYMTGAGCTATSLIAVFLSVDPDTLEAAATALSFFGLAGEMAGEFNGGPGTFQTRLLDALYLMDEERVIAGAKITTALIASGAADLEAS
jgi:hydroxyethylthiazole kinase